VPHEAPHTIRGSQEPVAARRGRPERTPVQALLKLSSLIDRLNLLLGKLIMWLVLAAVLISAGNAIVRKAFNVGSNAWLEIQWYLFAGLVMFGAAQVLRVNEHVRVDVLYGLYPTRTKVIVDLLGLCLFLLPAMGVIAWLSLPYLAKMYTSGEMSSNAGGLIRWPVTATVPLGLALLSLQGLSEIIKRVGWLRHEFEMDTHYDRPLQ